jgi:membrane protease YdiL (CAAX protease family)
MVRPIDFARSVIPRDPTQLLFLLGSVLLFISIQLRCFPAVPENLHGVNSLQGVFPGNRLSEAYQSWILFSIAARLLIFLAGAAGLFICFWPGTRPVVRILVFVLVPAIAGIAALCIRFDEVARTFSFSHVSVLEGGFQNGIWRLRTVWSLGPALHASALGMALVLVFLPRLVKGTTCLPLSLAWAADGPPSQDQEWRRICVFVYVAITGTFEIVSLSPITLLTVYQLFAGFTHFSSLPPALPLLVAIMTACLAGVAAWAAGESRWREFRRFVGVPETQYGVLGVIFPIAIQLTPNLVLYVSDQVHWAAIYFSNFSRPGFASYFPFPDPLYFWYLIAACLEEIIWRGYLQPRFVRRYGLTRGIFLLGVVWSAFHFLGDFTKTTEDYQVLSVLASRFSLCIAMSYVLGWLTLRSGSIWPAALAHGLSNVWALSLQSSRRAQQSELFAEIITVICWSLLGVLLFRFWPPSIGTEVPDRVTRIGTEPTA